MFGFFLLGLFWMVAYYVTQGALPLGSAFPSFNLKDANILIGFGLVMVGFAMTTRWK
jgi:lipoprotein signal peptidase